LSSTFARQAGQIRISSSSALIGIFYEALVYHPDVKLRYSKRSQQTAMLIYIFFGFFCCAASSLSFGITAVRMLKLPLDKGETVALGYVAGSALVSTLTLMLGLIGAIAAPVFVAIAFLSILILWKHRKWFSGLANTSIRFPFVISIILSATLIFYGILYVRLALSPEISPDATVYHLGLVNLWANRGRIYRIADIYAAMPEGVEMLFLLAFTIGRHSAASLVHLSFLIDLPLLMLLYGRRFGWTCFASAFAAILVFASPLFGTFGTVAYVDVALACTVFATLYLLEIWRRNGDAGYLVLCGLTAGFALATKYTAAPLPVLAGAIIVWKSGRDGWRKAAKAASILLCAILFVSGPYFLRNWAWFHNPIAPFGNAIFPNPWFHVSLERLYVAGQVPRSGARWWRYFLGLTVGNSLFDSSLGAAFLLIPLGLAGLIWRQSRMLTFAALLLGLAWLTNKDPRFLMPAAPAAAMALGFALSRMPGSKTALCALAVLHIVISSRAFMDYTHFRPVFQWRISPTWRESLRLTPQSEYLGRNPEYVMAQHIEALVPAKEPVLAFTGGAAQSYTTRRIIVCWTSAYGERMADLLFSKWHSPHDRRERFSFRVPPVAVTKIRIVQEGADDSLMWNVDEVELHADGKLLAPSRGWQLNAVPNPWDVPAAFDGNLATRWRSWDSLRPGMFIRTDFLKAVKLDSVEVVLDNREWTTLEDGTWAAHVSLDVLTGDGRELHLNPAVTWDMPIDLRKDATAALKANGIHYVLINQSDWVQHEFRDHPEAWNMRAIATTSVATLYQLE